MLPYLIAGAIGFGIGKLFENGGETFMAGGMTNEDILRSFLTSERETQTNNLATFYSTLGGVMLLRNYGTLIAVRMGRRVEITNVKHSKTTSAITNRLKALAEEMGYSVFYVSEFENGGETFMAGGNPNSWSVSDLSNGKYLGIIEFQDNDGEYHNFEIMETDDRLVFGGMTNTGFIESGYIEKDGFSTDETLQSLIEDLEVYYNDGAEYTSQIVFNERMENGGEASEKYILRRGTPIRKNIRKKRPKTREPKMVRTIFEEEYFKDFDNGGEADDVEQNFKVGNIVELSESGWDNENYHDFFEGVDNVKLVITDVYTNKSQHQGFDEGVGMALYSTKRFDNNEIVPFDLYDYELEYVSKGKKFADGGEAGMIYLISDNATPKREISISENDILRESKNFFNWRNVSVKRIKSLGSTDYDKFIEFLYKKGYGKEEYAVGGEIKYAIYEDYYGNDIKTEKFKKGMSEDEIEEPKGYMIADFDQDEDGVMYVRFQQEEEEFAGGGVAKKRRRSASTQYGRSNTAVDKTRVAKPVGYRFSNAKANQLRKDPYAKPTEAQVKKYLGKGIYKENRKNRSDRDRNAKI